MDIWNALIECVEKTQCLSLKKNIKHPIAKKMMFALRTGYSSILMQKDGSSLCAAFVEDFLGLADLGYKPVDHYMQGFIEKAALFLSSILIKSLCINSVLLANREMQTERRFLSGGIAISIQDTDAEFELACPLTSVTRYRGVSLCIRIIKPATLVELCPHAAPQDGLDMLHLANKVVHRLLFDTELTSRIVMGILYFLSIVENLRPQHNTAYLELADALLCL